MSGSGTSLAPGFRFHPTDEELVRYYLRRKICGKSFRFNAISDVDIYKLEPWDLPGKSILKTRDLEWYFFSGLDKKYGNGSRTNRATDRGYWKTTGKDRAVYHNSKIAGMKKTLVYHTGRAPRGERTNWVMHEYRLIDEDFQKDGIAQVQVYASGDGPFLVGLSDEGGFLWPSPFSLGIFQKSGSGPKNGEQYGAPFVEEEWEEDEVAVIPGEQSSEEVAISDDAYVEINELEQKLATCIPPQNAQLPLNVYGGDTSNHVADPKNISEDNDQKPTVVAEEFDLWNLTGDQQYYDVSKEYELDSCHIVGENVVDSSIKMNLVDADYLLNEPYYDANDVPPFDDGLFLETNDLTNNAEADQQFYDVPEEYELDSCHVVGENVVDSSIKMNLVDADYLLNEPYYDANDVPPFDDGLFLETNDLTNNAEADSSSLDMLEEYLAYFDAYGNSISMVPDYPDMRSSESILSDSTSLTQKVDGGMMQQQLANTQGSDVMSFSNEMSEDAIFHSEFKHSFASQATRMLGNIPARPAYASEFPSKAAALQLASLAGSLSLSHVTTQKVEKGDTDNGFTWSLDKNGNLELLLSFPLRQGEVSSTSVASLLARKTASAVSCGWCYLIFGLSVLSISLQIGSFMCAK